MAEDENSGAGQDDSPVCRTTGEARARTRTYWKPGRMRICQEESFGPVLAVPASAKLLSLFKAGEIAKAVEVQRRLNRCFPRGGEEALGHLGTAKVTASVVTGIDMGPARPPYMAPDDAAERLRKRLLELL